MHRPISGFQVFDPRTWSRADRQVLEAAAQFLLRYRQLILPEGERTFRPPDPGLVAQLKANAVAELLAADRRGLTQLAESSGEAGLLAGQPEAAWEATWYRLLPRWFARRGVFLQVTPRRLDEAASGDQVTVDLFSLYRIGRIDRNVRRVIWGESIELDELEVQAALRLSDLGQPSEPLVPFADHELAMIRMPPAEAELAYVNLIIYAPSLTKSEEADIAFFAGGFAQNPRTRELANQTLPSFSEGFLRLAREGRKIDARQYALLRLGAQLVDQERADLARIRARWQAMRRERLRVHERNHERDRRLGRIPPTEGPPRDPDGWARYLNRWSVSTEFGSYLTGIRELQAGDRRLSLMKLLSDVGPEVGLVGRLANLAILDRLVTEIEEHPERHRGVVALEGPRSEQVAQAGLSARAQIIAQLPLLSEEQLAPLLDAVHDWHEARFEELFVPLDATFEQLYAGPIVQLRPRVQPLAVPQAAPPPQPEAMASPLARHRGWFTGGLLAAGGAIGAGLWRHWRRRQAARKARGEAGAAPASG